MAGASLLLAATFAALAQAGGDFAIPRAVIASGGGTSSGGDFLLRGTAGQADANSAPATGGIFELRGGFWQPGPIAPPPDAVFAIGFEP